MMDGLLGRSLGHSFSPQIHARLGNDGYQLFEREPDDLAAFFADGDWQGVNVTIPYKEAVMLYCDVITEQAQRIGCVNTIVRRADGSLHATNTDYDGIVFALRQAGIEARDRKCLILGTGATAKTLRTVLTDLGAREILNIGRHDAIPYGDIHLHHDAEVILNATPVGMYPKCPARLIDLDGFTQLEAVFDVIYNPRRTQLLLDAEARGVKTCDGLPMLVAQAVYAAAFCDGTTADTDVQTRRVLAAMRAESDNLVLIGMPGSGKSTVGQALAKALERPFIDIDARIDADYGSVADYINTHGEAAFRAIETAVIAEVGREHGLVIATGGGAVTTAANKDLLRQNGRLYWLTRDLASLPTEGRPLSAGGIDTLRRLERERRDLYADFADAAASNDGALSATVSTILEDFHETMRH